MEKIKSLNRYQKAVLIVMIAMALVFAGIYSMTISRVGFAYRGAILVPSQENGSTVYSGRVQGRQARFTVSEDKTVVFQYGDQTYGPYTAKEDSAAAPQDVVDFEITVTSANGGIARDEYGNIIDPAEPSAYTIQRLVNNPELTHRGDWIGWFLAVFICILNALFIFFADEIFLWNLALRIRCPHQAEPSDWEIAGRYVGWTALTVGALVLFVMGLQ